MLHDREGSLLELSRVRSNPFINKFPRENEREGGGSEFTDKYLFPLGAIIEHWFLPRNGKNDSHSRLEDH